MTTREDWDAHSFSVGSSVDGTRITCSCGAWTGPTIPTDPSTGLPDKHAVERAYDEWDRHHVPGYQERNRSAGQGTCPNCHLVFEAEFERNATAPNTRCPGCDRELMAFEVALPTTVHFRSSVEMVVPFTVDDSDND